MMRHHNNLKTSKTYSRIFILPPNLHIGRQARRHSGRRIFKHKTLGVGAGAWEPVSGNIVDIGTWFGSGDCRIISSDDVREQRKYFPMFGLGLKRQHVTVTAGCDTHGDSVMMEMSDESLSSWQQVTGRKQNRQLSLNNF